MKVKFTVTQDDIDAACYERPTSSAKSWKAYEQCPVARAIRREYPNFVVRIKYAEEIEGDRRVIRFPPRVVRFINQFDDRQPVKPFSFTAEMRT